MKWYSIIFITLIVLLVFAEPVLAVDLLNGTVLNTTVSNTSMTFEACEINVTQSVVSNISIELSNPFYISSPAPQFTLPIFINFTDQNAHIDCGGLGPRFGTTLDQAILFCDQMRDAFGNISLTNFLGIYEILGIWIVLSVIAILIFVVMNRDALADGDFVIENLRIVGLAILGMGVIALLLVITLFTVEVICIP